ncbi:hypothetical protein FGB62_195g08 [Gracilaria domingensis]|nr:hypothetical protein FGB62_195g08 [Gracilaria domingensis]
MGGRHLNGGSMLSSKRDAHKSVANVIKKPKLLNSRRSVSRDVVLKNSIPDVLRWVREQMDAEDRSSGKRIMQCTTHSASQTPSRTCSARAVARQIRAKNNVRILLNSCDYWKGETRMWENVCALCAKLPSKGNGNNIFDAMSRYPSSLLVYHGLKSIYGRNVVIAGKKIPRITVRENALNLFSPTASEETISKKWFEPNSLTRMQEVFMHMCAISEYILRCAYICKQARTREGNPDCELFSLLETRIKEDRDYRGRKVLRFEQCLAPDELCVDFLSLCVQDSTYSAHTAVTQGAKEAVRKYGRKEGNGKERGRIQLWMLKRPLPEVLDALIQRIEEVVSRVLGNELDVEELRFRTMRLMQKVEKIYEDVGNVCFNDERSFRVPRDLPKKTRVLASSSPYTLHFR